MRQYLNPEGLVGEWNLGVQKPWENPSKIILSTKALKLVPPHLMEPRTCMLPCKLLFLLLRQIEEFNASLDHRLHLALGHTMIDHLTAINLTIHTQIDYICRGIKRIMQTTLMHLPWRRTSLGRLCQGHGRAWLLQPYQHIRVKLSRKKLLKRLLRWLLRYQVQPLFKCMVMINQQIPIIYRIEIRLVLSWFLKSSQGTMIYATIVKEMWEELKTQFSQGNEPRSFQLQKDLASLSQDFLSVIVYYRKFKCLWDELFNYN